MSGNQKAGTPLKVKVLARSCVGLCLLGIVNHTMFAQIEQSSAPGPNTIALSKSLTPDVDEPARLFGRVLCGACDRDPIDGARHVHGIDIWTEISAADGSACECVHSFLVMRAVC
jgi:hypothetical protein